MIATHMTVLTYSIMKDRINSHEKNEEDIKECLSYSKNNCYTVEYIKEGDFSEMPAFDINVLFIVLG